MSDRDDLDETLRAYIQALPDGRRVRDKSERRPHVIPALTVHAEAQRRRAKRRRMLTRVLTGAVASSVSLSAALWFWHAKHDVSEARTALPPVSDVVDLAEIGALETTNANPVHVKLADLVRITLAPASRVRPVAGGPGVVEAIALERGSAHFDVKKVADGRRFHVLTPDADVEVGGTSFDVALRPGKLPHTCVSVTEGVAWVARGLEGRLLSPGQSFGCEETAEK